MGREGEGVDVAIIGAAGVCARQWLFQVLGSGALQRCRRLQLVGHRGGSSEHQLWGLRADAVSAFEETAPPMEVVLEPDEVDADLVVMMAGATVPTDATELAGLDRAVLAQANREMFQRYAAALGRRDAPATVVVQSNPVETGVAVFSQHLPRHRVLGAAGLSDTGRFAAEVAADLGRHRYDVRAWVLGQHGDHVVPLWSQLAVRGLDDEQVADYVARVRRGRSLSDLPDEIREGKARMLELIRAGEVVAAQRFVAALPADTRSAVKPFFIHFTAGRTTEAVTAFSAAWITRQIMVGVPMMISAQVRVEGEFLGLAGVTSAPVILSPNGWSRTVAMDLADDEVDLLHRALTAAA